MQLHTVVEGNLDEAILRRLAQEHGHEIVTTSGKQGKAYIKENISRFNYAANELPWLVLVDLDREEPCAPALVQSYLPVKAPKMYLRIAVNAVEAWLLADANNISNFLRVSINRIPAQPDSLDDPKQTLINIARKSRLRDIKLDIVPRPGTDNKEGPAYTSRLSEFVSSTWNPSVAADSSDSLRRCMAALERLSRQSAC